MNKETQNDAIIDTILNYIYLNKKNSFTFYELDKELAEVMKNNGINYEIYGGLIPNVLFALVTAGRFKIEKDSFIYIDNNAKVNPEQKEYLISIKEKHQRKYKKKIKKNNNF